jgi:pyruvate/2-oxoglutarate dehydrogenase complex dihydrolipoamide acyltransferase (E2) component
VIRGADRLSLLPLSREARRLAEAAREDRLEAADLAGGSFTVSNLGAFGIRCGTPVLNPPEAVLVFVGAVEERPVVRDGAIVARPTLTLSIAYDHRVADGAAAARVTRRVRELLESPAEWATGGR